jgi:hypothetical protein
MKDIGILTDKLQRGTVLTDKVKWGIVLTDKVQRGIVLTDKVQWGIEPRIRKILTHKLFQSSGLTLN